MKWRKIRDPATLIFNAVIDECIETKSPQASSLAATQLRKPLVRTDVEVMPSWQLKATMLLQLASVQTLIQASRRSTRGTTTQIIGIQYKS